MVPSSQPSGSHVVLQITIEQNRCAMAYQGCGAVFIFSTIIKKGNGNSF